MSSSRWAQRCQSFIGEAGRLLAGLKDAKAKEAVLLSSRIDMCNHASRVSAGTLLVIPRRDLNLHLKSLSDAGHDDKFSLQLQLQIFERRLADAMSDVVSRFGTDAFLAAENKRTPLLQGLVDMICPWSSGEKHKYCHSVPKICDLIANLRDKHASADVLAEADQDEDIIEASRLSEWEAGGC
jgi:hypothetical protein